jgi:hypothetical protein
MRIDFLYWEECPSHEPALQRLRAVLGKRHIADPVHVIEVTTEQEAAALRFPGSPTIRVDGQDLFPAPDGPYGLSCRIYHTSDGRVTPLPTTSMLDRALHQRLEEQTERRRRQ